jgi:ABC-2 type transport system permease protein
VFLKITGKERDDELEVAEGAEKETWATITPVSTLLEHSKPGSRSRFPGNKFMFGWRNLIKIKHIPEQFMDVLITPIMFTFMFTYLFGGALAGSPKAYLQFFIPGILVQRRIEGYF